MFGVIFSALFCTTFKQIAIVAPIWDYSDGLKDCTEFLVSVFVFIFILALLSPVSLWHVSFKIN